MPEIVSSPLSSTLSSTQAAPASLLAVNPYFLVDDVHASAEYYRDVLGFHFEQFWGEPPSFVILRRNGIQIMLRAPAEAGNSVVRPNGRRIRHSFDAYIYVNDIDALHAELAARGAKLLGDPCDQAHDCREFELEDLNGYVICFGQNLLS